MTKWSRACWPELRSAMESTGRAVTVILSGSNTHSDNFEGTPRQAAFLDQAMSTLLADLQAKGLKLSAVNATSEVSTEERAAVAAAWQDTQV